MPTDNVTITLSRRDLDAVLDALADANDNLRIELELASDFGGELEPEDQLTRNERLYDLIGRQGDWAK